MQQLEINAVMCGLQAAIAELTKRSVRVETRLTTLMLHVGMRPYTGGKRGTTSQPAPKEMVNG